MKRRVDGAYVIAVAAGRGVGVYDGVLGRGLQVGGGRGISGLAC
jgi:hypothetical protein